MCLGAITSFYKACSIACFYKKDRGGVGSAFYDASTYAKGHFAPVPEGLRPKPGHMSIAQQQVDEGV